MAVVDFEMPKLGEVMEEGTVSEWFKEPGETVSLGDPLVAVESDKAVLEVESPVDGVLKEILVEVDEKVPVGTVCAKIETD